LLADIHKIRACLQSALELDELRDHAFSAWAALVTTIDEEDLEIMLDHTFAVVVRHWSSFSPESQQRAYDTIAHLLKTHSALVRDKINSLPSLASIPLMSKFESEIARLKAHLDLTGQFEVFSRRCEDKNVAVVEQALRELVPFLETNQGFIHESAVSQQPSPVITQLCRSLLDACTRFNERHFGLVSLCAQCLGLVGCLDPNRVEVVKAQRDILVLSNFEQAKEAVDFVAFLLETILVKSFNSATTGRAQNFLAYVMQELLRFCRFNEVATYRPRASQPDYEYQRWMQIPEYVRTTLTPYLTSSFSITSVASATSALQSYPIFRLGMSHGTWLRTFVFDLLRRGKGDNAQKIFTVLARVIRGHDISIASFMLPFAALNVILGGDEAEVEGVRGELLTVLEQGIDNSSQVEADNIKKCSEVRQTGDLVVATFVNTTRTSSEF